MTKDDSIIFLTDKYGRRDRTTEIENISYDKESGFWNIDFVGDQRTFHYKRENLQVIKNCLKDKQSERDKKKDQIFELIELPLLRLNTKGSNEENKIRNLLDTFIEAKEKVE